MLPRSWKNSFNNGIIIPTILRFCNKYIDKRVCNRCNFHVIENKKFEANLNKLKRRAPKQFDHMLPCFKEKDDLIVIVHLLYVLFSFF